MADSAASSTFAEIMAYVDQLHQDVGQMVALVEKRMAAEGYEGLPQYGNRTCWQFSSHWRSADTWRASYVARVYVPEGETTYTAINVVMACLKSVAAFPFPPLICARYEHPPLTGAQINSSVFNTFRLRSLSQSGSEWRGFREEHGWCVAEPAHKAETRALRGYILNLFDMVDAQAVEDNIIQPLMRPDENLDDMLTVQKHRFPAMEG